MGVEDRGAVRIPVVIEGTIVSEEDEPFEVLVTDLSLTGAFVVAPVNLPKGATIQLQMTVDEQPEPVICTGRVARLEQSGMGLLFDDEQDTSFEYVTELCS